MDGRDSSPAAAGEDERVVPVTDGLAKEAEALFSSRRFVECVDVLNQLLEKKEGDPKVLHNIAVAECFRDGCSDPRKLLDVLNTVKKRSEELAHSLGDQGEAGNLGNNMSGSKGSGTNLHQLSSTDTSSIAYADQFDTSIISLNTAIVLYHLHEYTHALTILEPLYQNIDPIDETTALHVCLLLLDIAFASHDASKAADVIQYLEKCFGVGFMANQIDNGNTTHQSLNQGPKASTTNNTTMPDASNSDSNAGAYINENSLSVTLSDDALEYENLYSTLDGSGQNLGRPSNDLAKASADRVAPATELKLKMHLYKVRLLLLARNLKAAKREVKLAMNRARGRDSSTELLIKSQLEYARGNHRKAVKLLMTSSNRTEPGMLSIFNNNLGCIHYQLRSHHASGILFSMALKNSSMLRKEKPLKLSTFSQDRSLLIMYNCGIHNLACRNPLIAAQCFGKASLVLYNRPLLWLHLAECCRLALETGLLRSGGEEIRVHVAGSGRWRQLVVDDLTSRNGYSKAENKDEFKLSLPFARQCLQNTLLLLYKNDQMIESGASVIALDEDDSSQAKSGFLLQLFLVLPAFGKMGLSLIEGFTKSIAMTVLSEIGDKTFFSAAKSAPKAPYAPPSYASSIGGYMGAAAPSSIYIGAPPYAASLLIGPAPSPYNMRFPGSSAYPFDYGSRSVGSLYGHFHMSGPPYSSGSMIGPGGMYGMSPLVDRYGLGLPMGHGAMDFFEAPAGAEPLALYMGSMWKGQIWINGHHIGRYWTAWVPNGYCNVAMPALIDRQRVGLVADNQPSAGRTKVHLGKSQIMCPSFHDVDPVLKRTHIATTACFLDGNIGNDGNCNNGTNNVSIQCTTVSVKKGLF